MKETATISELIAGASSTGISRAAVLRDGMAKAIERAAGIIDLETTSLRNYRQLDLTSCNHQKSHALLELTRAMRALPANLVDQEILQGLARLREKLEENLEVLDVHLKAVRQVSALIARAIEDDNSDGTYSMSINQRVRPL
jgi:hypothetical protein